MKQQSEKFSVSYDADDDEYKLHRIDALTLGNSIIGMHEIIAEANSIINNGTEVELQVTSPVVEEGSVIIDFLLSAASAESLEILKYLGLSTTGAAFAGGSLLEIVKKLKNRKITNVVIEGDSDTATITVDGEEIECSKFVAKLAVDRKVRSALHNIVQVPLAGKKGSTFKVIDGNHKTVETIIAATATNFSPLPIGSMESEETTRDTITAYFIQVHFDSPKNWKIRFVDNTEHSIEIKDEVFLKRVAENKQKFSKEDLFEIEIEIKSTFRQTRASHKYSVIKVTKHFAEKERRLV